MTMRDLSLVAAGVMILTLCGTAGATRYTEGDPTDIGSWSQQWYENQLGITSIQAKIDGANFTSPAGSEFSISGWTLQWQTSNEYVAAGPATTAWLWWNENYQPATTVPFTVHYQAYIGNTLAVNQDCKWSPGWSYPNPTWEQETPLENPIPEPLTLLAFGSAVAGIGAYIRKRRLALA